MDSICFEQVVNETTSYLSGSHILKEADLVYNPCRNYGNQMGNIWTGLGDHLFNNTVAANMLHVVSLNGEDELQLVRIMAAQLMFCLRR